MSSSILTNWTVYYADDAAAGAGMKQIKWTGGLTGTNTVKELYTALMDLFDAAANNDATDSIPLKAITPTLYEIGIVDAGDRQPWFIDPESVKHLTSGGLNTSGWLRDTTSRTASHGIYKLTKSTNVITTGDIGRQFTTNTSATGWILHVSATHLWIRPSSYEAFHDMGGVTSITASGTARTDTVTAYGTAESVWANVFTLGAIEANTDMYIYQNSAALTPWWLTGHIDVLVLVRDFGTLIDSGNITIFARQYTKLYDHYQATITAGGRIPIPIATSPDTNNLTSTVVVAGYNDISISFGSYSHDVDNDSVLEPYDVEINCAGRSVAQVYEYLKYVTRQGETALLDSIPGEAYIAAQPGYNPVKAAPFGTFAGGRFFGARGVYIHTMASADANRYELIDADGNPHSPPSSITLSVNGLAVNDQVAVFKATGDNNTIDKTMFTINATTPVGSGTLSVRVNEAIPSDTPGTGTLRLVHRNASGQIESEERVAYSSWNNADRPSYSTFVVAAFTSTLDANDTAYVPYLDVTADATSESVSLIYVTDRYITARVRKSGILPFMAKYQLTNANLTITAVRSDDPLLS